MLRPKLLPIHFTRRQKGGFAKEWFWRMYPRAGFRGNIRMYPRSGFRSGGTFAKTTLLENHPFGNPGPLSLHSRCHLFIGHLPLHLEMEPGTGWAFFLFPPPLSLHSYQTSSQQQSVSSGAAPRGPPHEERCFLFEIKTCESPQLPRWWPITILLPP